MVETHCMALVQEKGRSIKNKFSGKKERKSTTASKTAIKKEIISDRKFAEISSQIDNAFEQFYFELDEEETKAHMMRL